MSKKRTLTISLSEEQYLTLKKWAVERETTLPEFVVEILRKEIVEYEATGKALNIIMREIQGWEQ